MIAFNFRITKVKLKKEKTKCIFNQKLTHMKTLGLDVGTNSIGWALIENERIISLGSRIVPMGAEVKEFEKGNAQTKNADHFGTEARSRSGRRQKKIM